MRKLAWLFALLLVTLVVGGTTAGASSALSNVKLTPPDNPLNGFEDAGGQVQLFLWDIENNSGFSDNNLIFDTQIRKLPVMRGGWSAFYTMWVTLDDADPQLVHSFNVSAAAGGPTGVENFVGAVIDFGDEYLAAHEVWIDIYLEYDDGCPGWKAGDGWQCGTLVLSGHLDRGYPASTTTTSP